MGKMYALDWDVVNKSAQAVGAERMVNVALQLVEDLLRSEIPAAAKIRMERDRGASASAGESNHGCRMREPRHQISHSGRCSE